MGGDLRAEDAVADREAAEDESKLTALSEGNGEEKALVEGEMKNLGKDEEHQGFDRDKNDHKSSDRERLGSDEGEVDTGSDGEEEDGEEERFERLDIGLEFVSIGAACQHNSGDEGAERGGEAN